MDESDVNLINKSIDMQKLIMGQAWKKAREEIGAEKLGKMLHMKLGDPTQKSDSLHAEASFDKLLEIHVMTCAYSHSKVEVKCLKGLNILALVSKQARRTIYWRGGSWNHISVAGMFKQTLRQWLGITDIYYIEF